MDEILLKYAEQVKMDPGEFKKSCDLIRNYANSSPIEEDYYNFIRMHSKKNGAIYELFLKSVRGYIKENKKFSKQTKHYHRTNLENFKTIINSNALLSREEQEKIGIDTSKLNWSSSENVQFTCDYFNEQDVLIKPGFDEHSVGNSNSGVVFVFGPSIINVDSYECNLEFPTVSKVNIKQHCIAILADNEDNLEQVKQTLIINNMSEIPIVLTKDWDVNISPIKLETKKKIKKSQKEILLSKKEESKVFDKLLKFREEILTFSSKGNEGKMRNYNKLVKEIEEIDLQTKLIDIKEEIENARLTKQRCSTKLHLMNDVISREDYSRILTNLNLRKKINTLSSDCQREDLNIVRMKKSIDLLDLKVQMKFISSDQAQEQINKYQKKIHESKMSNNINGGKIKKMKQKDEFQRSKIKYYQSRKVKNYQQLEKGKSYKT